MLISFEPENLISNISTIAFLRKIHSISVFFSVLGNKYFFTHARYREKCLLGKGKIYFSRDISVKNMFNKYLKSLLEDAAGC